MYSGELHWMLFHHNDNACKAENCQYTVCMKIHIMLTNCIVASMRVKRRWFVHLGPTSGKKQIGRCADLQMLHQG